MGLLKSYKAIRASDWVGVIEARECEEIKMDECWMYRQRVSESGAQFVYTISVLVISPRHDQATVRLGVLWENSHYKI